MVEVGRRGRLVMPILIVVAVLVRHQGVTRPRRPLLEEQRLPLKLSPTIMAEPAG